MEQRCSDGEESAPSFVIGISAPAQQDFLWTPGKIGLIGGGPGSGKSTLLKNLQRHFEEYYVRRSILADARSLSITDLERISTPKIEVLFLDNADELLDSVRVEIERLVNQGLQLIMTSSATFRSMTKIPCAHLRRLEGSDLLLSPRSAQDADFFGWQGCPIDPVPGRAIQKVGGNFIRIQTWSDSAEPFQRSIA
jgi:hypothetical protein